MFIEMIDKNKRRIIKISRLNDRSKFVLIWIKLISRILGLVALIKIKLNDGESRNIARSDFFLFKFSFH